MVIETVSLVIVIGTLLYALPSFIAYCRGHQHLLWIILLNFFLGWTIIGWLGAFLWAVLKDEPPVDSKRVTRGALIVGLIAVLLFIGLTVGMHRFVGNLFTSEPQDPSWQLSTQVGYLISPYPFAQLPSDTTSGASSSLYVHCRNGVLQTHIGTNLHGQLPGDAGDKPVKARHRVGQGDWVDLEWIAKRGGVTYPRTDFGDFISSWDKERSDLVVEFETGTTVQFPVWDGYDEMRTHITCLE